MVPKDSAAASREAPRRPNPDKPAHPGPVRPGVAGAESHDRSGTPVLAEESSADEEERREARGTLSVILVEDNPDHALLAGEALEERGHRVLHCQHAHKALEAWKTGGFDAVVLDYRLPDMSGLEALKHFASLRATPPVVMITASGSEEIAVQALKDGATDYVVKTGSHGPALARAVELAVAKHRMEEVVALHRRELERRANTDALTGLYNRHRLDDELSVVAVRAVQNNEPYAVGVIDIDHFKQINDTRGHAVGDAVLVEFARVLRECVRKEDILARYGGDEFVVIMPGATAGSRARFVQRLQRALRASPLGPRLGIPLSASVGMADWSCGAPDEVLREADLGMYEDKATPHTR